MRTKNEDGSRSTFRKYVNYNNKGGEIERDRNRERKTVK